MVTRILSENEQDLRLAGEIIAAGGLVAFPTETVYGLGANALDPDAVRKIYEAKGRPSDNPTIVHIADESALKQLTWRVTPDMQRLARKYWPGPLTMVVPRRDTVPNVTTGNLDTVGVRMPDHVTARALIQAAGCPIAAPSANLSGKPSPTTVEHVIDDMDGRIDAIIRSTPCTIGIESTVIDMTGELPMILRPGFITREDVERTLGKDILVDPTLNEKPEPGVEFRPKAPGMKYKHYAPEADMIIFEGETEAVEVAMDEERAERESLGQKVVVIRYSQEDTETAAHEFFAALRDADKDKADIILAAALPQEGIGFSVMNR
ncbi:MAG: threonylcarbamoyl-AMP synthase, partial [Eubacterium sp.]|nr:threonylcarbamoyl-AMP synthase [Eubacterium sp.]